MGLIEERGKQELRKPKLVTIVRAASGRTIETTAWEPQKITNPCCYSTQAGGEVIFAKPAEGSTWRRKTKRDGEQEALNKNHAKSFSA